MAHHALKSDYHSLVRRLNKFPQGAPPSDLLFQILKMLFSEKEAHLVALLPIVPFSIADAARAWKIPQAQARKILDQLADRALLLDGEQDGRMTYTLPPPMAGFFEFSLMRVREDLDQKTLSELYYQYVTVEEDFIKDLFARGETQLGRVFVHEPALSPEHSLYVLDYERASQVIQSASHRAVGMCYCRHKMAHLDKACQAPMNICMTFNHCGEVLARHGFAREIDRAECMDLLQSAYDHQLVQFGENVRERVSFICNCCGCCCEAMLAAQRFGILHPVHTTNFLPLLAPDRCTGCGRCVSACPVQAWSLVPVQDSRHPQKKQARLDETICLGCGVCVRACTQAALSLRSRPQRVITPLDSVHRAVMMAIERGTLQHLIFSQQAFASHRAMAAILGVILKLPPIKQALASRQFKSRYLEKLIQRTRYGA
ncbi:MAG TPA: 4Fe-4S dicluster domain-containing protein [bacterium]|nr:4Fe-4S dicluster domain-containing protein [bacterium]HPN33895.1 4Fe-4S dicluster domain-containing protein [bacterium]